MPRTSATAARINAIAPGNSASAMKNDWLQAAKCSRAGVANRGAPVDDEALPVDQRARQAEILRHAPIRDDERRQREAGESGGGHTPRQHGHEARAHPVARTHQDGDAERDGGEDEQVDGRECLQHEPSGQPHSLFQIRPIEQRVERQQRQRQELDMLRLQVRQTGGDDAARECAVIQLPVQRTSTRLIAQPLSAKPASSTRL